MKRAIDYSLYLIADRSTAGHTLEESVCRAIQHGCTVVQAREKNVDSRLFFESAASLRTITKKYDVPLIINDRADIAVAVQADGVHLGLDDIPAREARKCIGTSMILGVSATSLDEALKAEADGADYLSVGAVYPTQTKAEAPVIGIDELARICATVKIPVLAVGGMNEATIPNLAATGVTGVCVASAILKADDVGATTAMLRKLIDKNKLSTSS